MSVEAGVGGGVVAVHGGAWDIPEPLWDATIAGVKAAAVAAHKVLVAGGSAVDGVVAAVASMEKDPVFDAGCGSVLTSAGDIEVSALLMEGSELRAGAVAAATNILLPIKLAQRVMVDTPHVLLASKGANEFAESVGISQHPIDDLVTDEARRQLQLYKKYKTAVNTLFNKQQVHDTVGCVAVDSSGLVACGTSTGGITGQLPGRVGDTPLVGSGGFADNLAGAVSTTGHGESITRVGLAHKVIDNITAGLSSLEAAEKALSYMKTRVGGCGGCVVVSRDGDVAYSYTTVRMPWAYVKHGRLHWGMNDGQHFTEPVNSG